MRKKLANTEVLAWVGEFMRPKQRSSTSKANSPGYRRFADTRGALIGRPSNSGGERRGWPVIRKVVHTHRLPPTHELRARAAEGVQGVGSLKS